MTDLALDTLEARGLIRVAALQPELEYLFRHALLQDTAYESLLRQERRALHQLVGQTLEELYPERAGELAAVLAMHFEQAGDTDKATRYLMTAARFALERNAIVEAYDLYSRAAALLPPTTEEDSPQVLRNRIEVALGRSRAGMTFVPEAEAIPMLEQVIADAERLGDPRLEADLHITLALMRQFMGDRPSDSPELRRSLERVSEIGRELGDPLIGMLPQSIIGLFSVFTGDLEEGVGLLQKVAPLLEQRHDFVGSSFALVALAVGLARMGRFAEAETAAHSARSLAERGDLIARLDSLIALSTVRSLRGDLEGAVPLAMECTNMAEETGAISCVVASNFLLGDVYTRQGRHEEARQVLRRGHDVAKAIADRQFRPSIAAYLRANAATMGDQITDAASFEEALELARRHGDRWAEATVIWKRAETVARDSDEAADRLQMLADYELAATAFERMGAPPYRARVLRDWGNSLRTLGRIEESDDRLRTALALFDELGIGPEADEVRATLAESSAS